MGRETSLGLLSAETGNEYIYRVEVNGRVYIGQSKAAKAGSRLHYRLRQAFTSSTYDVPELQDLIRKYGLENTKVTYYSAPDFGVSRQLLEDFKEQYVRGKDRGTVDDIDAAEILHILHCQHSERVKLLNTSMGGQKGSLTFVGAKGFIRKILVRTMSPAQAEKIFFSTDTKIEALGVFKNKFNKMVFNDAEWLKLIKTLETNSDYSETYNMLSNELKLACKQTWTSLIEEISHEINDLISKVYNNEANKNTMRKIIANKINTWAEARLVVFYSFAEAIGFKPKRIKALGTVFKKEAEQDIVSIDSKQIDELVLYLTNTIDWSIDAAIDSYAKKLIQQLNAAGLTDDKGKKYTLKTVKKYSGYKKVVEAAQKNWSKTKRITNFEIININAIIDTSRMNQFKNAFLESFNDWTPAGNSISELYKKQVAYDVFRTIYLNTKQNNFYERLDGGTARKYGDIQLAIPPYHKSLCSEMHRKYHNRNITFIDGKWSQFYREMISICTFHDTKWHFTEGNEHAYSYDVTMEVDGVTLPVAHQTDNWWLMPDVSKITIY